MKNGVYCRRNSLYNNRLDKILKIFRTNSGQKPKRNERIWGDIFSFFQLFLSNGYSTAPSNRPGGYFSDIEPIFRPSRQFAKLESKKIIRFRTVRSSTEVQKQQRRFSLPRVADLHTKRLRSNFQLAPGCPKIEFLYFSIFSGIVTERFDEIRRFSEQSARKLRKPGKIGRLIIEFEDLAAEKFELCS